MPRVGLLTSSLALLASLVGACWGTLGWITGLWVGAAWGVANHWLLVRVATLGVASPRLPRWQMAFLLGLKFVGLYGLAVWLLVGLRVAPGGWLTGFTLALIAFGLGFRGVRT